MLTLWTLLLACGNITSCDQVVNQFCRLEVECGRAASTSECLEFFEETLVCNEDDAIAAARAACKHKLEEYLETEPKVCFDRIPEECSDTMCSVDKGCDFSTLETGGGETVLHSSVTSGGSGAAGSHSSSEN